MLNRPELIGRNDDGVGLDRTKIEIDLYNEALEALRRKLAPGLSAIKDKFREHIKHVFMSDFSEEAFMAMENYARLRFYSLVSEGEIAELKKLLMENYETYIKLIDSRIAAGDIKIGNTEEVMAEMERVFFVKEIRENTQQAIEAYVVALAATL